MKEKILAAFEELGFKLDEVDSTGYSFRYESANMLWLWSADDEDFLNIALPGIYGDEGAEASHLCALSERITSTLKFVKAYIVADTVWLFYERELMGGEDIPLLLSRMILRLESALTFAHQAIKEMEEETGIGDEDEDVETVADEATDDEANDND